MAGQGRPMATNGARRPGTVGTPREGSGFGRAIVAAILEEIAARLARIGVIGGSRIDAGHLVGATPAGVGRITIQRDGLDVALTPTLNLVGPGWVVTANPAANRVDVGLASGGVGPALVLRRSDSEVVTSRVVGGEDVITRGA
jgi:hypothetical protein